LRWEFDRPIRIGRQVNLDLVLREHTVEKVHAEIKHGGCKWMVRDLADNPRRPTMVNGIPLSGGNRELRVHDVLQLGEVLLRVTELDLGQTDQHLIDPVIAGRIAPTRVLEQDDSPGVLPAGAAAHGPAAEVARGGLRSFANLSVETTAQQSWQQALEAIVPPGQTSPQGRAMLALLRANHHLGNLSTLDELLQSILSDALASLAAQRGAILLVDAQDHLVLKAMAAPRLTSSSKGYSKTIVERCFRRGESMLCQDALADQLLASARSVQRSSMASVICTLLRTPRKRLGVLHVDRGPMQPAFTRHDLHLADAIAASFAIGIECAQVVEQQREQFVETVSSLARAVEMRDQYNGDPRRVTDYALLLADELKLGQSERYQIKVGTPLHDIGKIGIDDAILRKPGKLTADEFAAMKSHTLKGAAILESIGSLSPMIPIVRHHHERWDGAGYPDGLAKDGIAMTARIVAVADAFDAMTSPRPYRPALPPQLAFLELLQKAGSHFDPACVQAFLRLRAKIESRMTQA
jgi:HD-GYP domain-containing protein (c-di-GMP phosphodiesterase class II)